MKYILTIILTSLVVIFLMFLLNIFTYNGKNKNNLNSQIPTDNDKK